MKLSLTVLTLFSVVVAAAAVGQSSVTTYSYDGRGRIIQVQTGGGAKSQYSYDRADNRSNVSVQRQLDTNSGAETWEAETLPHAVGFAQYAGWATNASDAPSAMTYGPYTNANLTGSHTAVWRIMIDNNAGSASDAVVRLDVNDADTDQVLATRTLLRSSFAAPMAYQIFELPFSAAASENGHHFEFRTWNLGTAYINVDKIARY